MNVNKIVRIIFLMTWSFDTINGLCLNFPYGHTCRNIDLTGFCLQVSQLLKFYEKGKPVKPYMQFERIFIKLVKGAKADKPYVYFGGYKKGNIYRACVLRKCTPAATGSSTTTSGPGGGGSSTTGGPPGPPPPPPCPPGPPPTPPPCLAPNFQAGPAAGTVIDDKYVGCELDCECCAVNPDDKLATGTIFSLQDGCELKYLKAPISAQGSVLNPIAKGATAKENPYRLEVTEIKVRGAILHNWLHVRIYSTGNAGLNSKDLGSGKIKMAFIVATDAMGFPVGEFVNSIPCGTQCNCTDPNTCHQGKAVDTIPCMFDGKRVVTNTGMMMIQANQDGDGEGLGEVHASWRFSQPASAENFITELHFKALVVDEYEPHKLLVNDSANMRISAISEARLDKEGMVGWNPVYDILHPTDKTVGASDYFREDIYTPAELNCHVPINQEYYIVEPYPDSGPEIRQLKPDFGSEKEHCYRLNDTVEENPPLDNIDYCFATTPTPSEQRSPVQCPGLSKGKIPSHFHDAYGFLKNDKPDPNQTYPWTLFGARTEAYVIREGALDRNDWKNYSDDPIQKLYWGTEHSEYNELQYSGCGTVSSGVSDYYGKAHNHKYPDIKQNYDIQGNYGHFCTDGSGRRVPNLPGGPANWPNYLAKVWKYPQITPHSYMDDRCYCPKLPATPSPRYREPPEVQVQGRRQHAYQMIIAWNCFVPFGIFISRYYKETYSKVFFLQEYWWYTIHVLCMITAAMFTFGGIYVMELKRRDPVNWLDGNITAHVIIGYSIILVFFFQVCTGFFRVRDPKLRISNIFTHWLLGVIEYLLAIVCMVNASFVLLSGMTCEGVVALGFLLIFQIMFYASMEVHMRNVDKLLKLNPPRSYLPPPIMRVFHKDAPDAKFRIHVLIAYFSLCVITSLIQFISMESNHLGESCFIKSKNYIDPSEFDDE